MRPPALFLLGPTASGKTAVALALAARLPVEIVSVDSALVYRDMDIGTAKPDRATRERFVHHLVDVVDPTQSYSAGRFREDALAVAGEIAARGRVPLFAGGTMLYERALMRGLAALPKADPSVRAALDARAAREGWPALHAELARVDPPTAARLDPNDAQRVQRALEVHALTGRPLSAHFAEGAGDGPPFRALRLSLEPSDRAVLHDRIAARLAAMIRAGLVDEVRALRSRYALHAAMPSMRAVGYRQVWETLEGAAPAATLEARAVAATRQLAKRQLTWLRAMTDVVRLDCLAAGAEAEALALARKFLDA